MRSSIIIASFVALVAALPAIVPVEKTSLAVRTESLDATVALEARQGFNPYDQTFSWPETEVYGGGLSAQFEATNLGNGNYKFQFWSSAPANGGTLNYRVSYGGKTLASVNLNPGKTTTVNVPKTGDNFNIFIQLA
ncbi:hypothetical protein C7974DRAFT_381755 [Boeremia exigua]|uniref:uncharacterized protein n=1 Tax=Boeremia exigua TaxID=749465 RepID=UPI001E8DA2C0|nr:uncharacterized protein C7974DRAFT_381755 [Boeremia exigua]KAH6643551.1 hypothetical protein C7974DRAFT_381755 [Boeremia exigua]